VSDAMKDSAAYEDQWNGRMDYRRQIRKSKRQWLPASLAYLPGNAA